MASTVTEDESLDFEVPSWAGKPPNGLHLDVTKGDKLIQKLMIDEKRYYVFGRNPKMCDFTIDHASCSRAHAVLTHHRFLQRMFLMDLGSTHGTFIGNVRLESKKPEQLLSNQTFHFGASSRRYSLREKPQSAGLPPPSSVEATNSEKTSISLVGLPEKEEELENLTEYNTALNRRVTSMAIPDDSLRAFPRKRKLNRISFSDEEEIINPEDVDPSIGRFRNLVQTAVISNKRTRTDSSESDEHRHKLEHRSATSSSRPAHSTLPEFGPISAKLGLSLPDLAPDVDLYQTLPQPAVTIVTAPAHVDEHEPRKKKYAKEAWPGKKPSHLLV